MNLAWFLYYGRKFGMSRQEILVTRYGEMLDMIECHAIYNGAKPAKKKRKLSMEEILALN